MGLLVLLLLLLVVLLAVLPVVVASLVTGVVCLVVGREVLPTLGLLGGGGTRRAKAGNQPHSLQ